MEAITYAIPVNRIEEEQPVPEPQQPILKVQPVVEERPCEDYATVVSKLQCSQEMHLVRATAGCKHE